MLTVRSTINVSSQTVPQIIPVVQGDTGRAILFTLADFTIPAGAVATYYVQKPSGEAVYNNATIDGNTVLVELTAQSIIEKGDNYGQVRIAVGEDVVTSFDFILLVKEFRGIDATQSLTEMNIFDKAVEQAADAIDEVKTDALDDIGDAKEEAIEEVTSNFDLKLDASSTKGVQNQVITQAINTVNNAIGDLSGETVTPTATHNYGVGGNVGQVIDTWATTDYWHGIYTVTAGNTYCITTVSDFPQQIVVWFTNASNTIIENHKAFATDHVEMVCTAPTGATKLFVMSYGYDAYHGSVQKVEPLSNAVTSLKEDLEEVVVDGYNLIKTAENGVGAYYASGSTLTFNASYTGYHYAIMPVEPNSRYYVSMTPRWWVLTDDNDAVLSSGAGFSPVTKRFINTGNATKLYYTIDNGTWNNEVNYGSKFALIIAKTNNGSGTIVGDKKPKSISGFTQRMSKNRYAFAVPRSRVMLTVGINQKWFYKNVLALDSNTCTISSTYSDYETDGVAFNVSSPNANGEFFARAYDQNLALVEQQSKITLIARTDNVMDCSALVIGDSTVAQNKMTESMLNAFANRNKTLTLLGTQGTSPNNHEGRSGWSAKQYCTQSANNPFYNNGFDFSHYMTNQGYSSVDFVVVQLGINDLFNAYGNFEDSDTAIDTTLGYLCDIINSILSWNASQKIIINLLTPANPTWNGYPMVLIRNIFVRYNAKALIELTKYSLDNVRVSNCHLILDPDNDISDTVHPKNAGYEKMGLEVVSQINCYQN